MNVFKVISNLIMRSVFFISGAISFLQKCQIMRAKVMYKYHRDLAEVNDSLARCYAAIGKFLLKLPCKVFCKFFVYRYIKHFVFQELP